MGLNYHRGPAPDRAQMIALIRSAVERGVTLPRFATAARKANRPVVDLLASIGGRKRATPAQIALAWLLAQKPWIAPIPGATKLNRLDENIASLTIELTPDDLRQIEDAVAQIKVEGDRYPPEQAERVGR